MTRKVNDQEEMELDAFFEAIADPPEWEARIEELLLRIAIALEHLDETKSRQAEYEGWLNE